MKNFIIPLWVLLFPVLIFSQTKEDYTQTVALINKAFNDKTPSLIHQKFNSDLKAVIQVEKLDKIFSDLHENEGKMSSYELLMDDKEEKNYLVEFENSSMLLILSLSSENEISKFKITEY